jgi:hypothetical protein
MPAVKRAVRAYIRKHGRTPSSRSIARELGDKDDRTVRAAWDKLAERGELPERPRSASAAGAAGQLLDNAIEYLRGFMDRAVQASGEEKAKGTDYWLTRLATINSLTDEAHRVITGEAVDDLIRDIQEKES